MQVADDGNGAYVANADAVVTEPVFTEGLLRETLLNPQSGYLTNPRLTCGRTTSSITTRKSMWRNSPSTSTTWGITRPAADDSGA